MALTIACAVISSPVRAADLAPGTEVVIDGFVLSVVSHDAFWFEQQGQRVLIYHHLMLPGELRNGQRLRVHGRVSDDWMRLAETEVNALRIETEEGLAGAR